MPRKSKSVDRKVPTNLYTCNCCGIEKKESQFFTSKWSPLWLNSNNHVLYCKDCISKLFQESAQRYKSEETALKICCHYLDIPFYGSLYKSITENNSIFNVGLYIRQIQLQQYQFQTFANTLVNGELEKSDNEIKKEIESKWSKSDKQNMNFAISVVGYDPFDNCGMTDNDRKYCFNILAGYCDSEGIQEDGHKVQSVIQITQSELQCRKLDEFINNELLLDHPDESRIKNLTFTKTQLLDSITKIAKDNNLSSNYNDNSKAGRNTLPEKIKQLTKDGYENIKVNLFDINTSNAMKQIADLSNESIMKQLNFDANDYTEIIKNQREMIQDAKSKLDQEQEENRILKNKLSDIESKNKRK